MVRKVVCCAALVVAALGAPSALGSVAPAVAAPAPPAAAPAPAPGPAPPGGLPGCC